MRVQVKVCGITTPEDAALAAALGAEAVGFNFVPGSPRRVSAAAARAMGRELPPFVLRVGVVADAAAAELRSLADEAGIHVLQYHGEETPEKCAAGPLAWFKAHRLSPGFQEEQLARYACGVHLLDAFHPGLRGGTGRTADWDAAARLSRRHPIILAGGLGPGNVREAVDRVRPLAVDVNSGVESSPGVKDAAALEALFRNLAQGGAR